MKLTRSQVLEALKQWEWADCLDGVGHCPVCGNHIKPCGLYRPVYTNNVGHRSDCVLAELIKRLEAKEQKIQLLPQKYPNMKVPSDFNKEDKTHGYIPKDSAILAVQSLKLQHSNFAQPSACMPWRSANGFNTWLAGRYNEIIQALKGIKETKRK